MKLYLDTETRSDVSLKKFGVHAYVASPQFAMLICTWAIDDEPVRTWEPVRGEPMPERLRLAIRNPKIDIVMHNSAFDRRVLCAAVDECVTSDRIIDTMVQALAHSLPAGLGDLSALFGLTEGKMREGKALIQQFCVPLFRSDPPRFNGPNNMAADWATFVEYARRDVIAMRELHKRMPTINYPEMERSLWELDQKINDRGLPVDLELAEAAQHEAEQEKARLNRQVSKLTHGAVGAATQRSALLNYLFAEHDVWLQDLTSDTVDRYLQNDDPSGPVQELLELRQQSSLNSHAKYRQVATRAINGRLQDTIQMYGASRTGRDSGRFFQPQNLMRPTRWRGLEGVELALAIENDVAAIKSGDIFDDNVMDLLGNCIRGVIRAPEGSKLFVSDLSNIEGRGLVWLSGEEWKLQYFRNFDKGVIKHDNYQVAYARAMNVPADSVDSYQRAIGKVMELGLGYGGGVSAFLTFASVYRLSIADLANAVWETADPNAIAECKDKYEWAKENGYHAGLPAHQYAACEYLKVQWRQAHPKTVEFWSDLEQAFRWATHNENETFDVGRLRFRRQGQWLYIRLPSGRCLTYLQPRIEGDQCTFLGVNSLTKRIERIKTYSGKLAENVTSGTARDVLFHRMPDIERAGYKIVLRVHDEIVAEAKDDGSKSADELSEMMALPYEWSTGLPLAAAGFETYRYRKG